MTQPFGYSPILFVIKCFAIVTILTTFVNSHRNCSSDLEHQVDDCHSKYVHEQESFGDLFCCSTIKFEQCLQSPRLNCSHQIESKLGFDPWSKDATIKNDHPCYGRLPEMPTIKCTMLYNWQLFAILTAVMFGMFLLAIGYCCCKCVLVCMILPKDKMGEAILNEPDRRVSVDY